jgi:hypothetical protein
LRFRVDEPIPADAEGRVVGPLVDAITATILRRRRDNLDQEVGRDPHRTVPRQRRMTRKIRHDVGLATSPGPEGELQLGADHDPATRAQPHT